MNLNRLKQLAGINKPATLYHVTLKSNLKSIYKYGLSPYITDRAMPGESKEPRICCATSLSDALKGFDGISKITQLTSFDDTDLYSKPRLGYYIKFDARFISPTVDNVPDVLCTNEKWVLEPQHEFAVGQFAKANDKKLGFVFVDLGEIRTSR